MTDKQPEALRLAEMLTADVWPGSVTLVSYARECVAELRRQHARIAELEAKLEAIGAGGVSGPLMGCASIAANAGSEPVAWRELCRRLYVELFYCNQQMTSGKRPKWQQGKTVRDVLADAKAALDAAPQPLPASQGDALDAMRYRWLRQEHERVDPVCHLTWKRNLQRDSSEWVNTAVLDTAIDNARKQGENHD